MTTLFKLTYQMHSVKEKRLNLLSIPRYAELLIMNKLTNLNKAIFLQTTLKDFVKQDFSVVRQHEEFIWLHDRFEENESYAGYIVS